MAGTFKLRERVLCFAVIYCNGAACGQMTGKQRLREAVFHRNEEDHSPHNCQSCRSLSFYCYAKVIVVGTARWGHTVSREDKRVGDGRAVIASARW